MLWRVLGCLGGCSGDWRGAQVLGGVLGRVLECLESARVLASWSEINVGNSSFNFHGFYSVKLLRYSDLGAK